MAYRKRLACSAEALACFLKKNGLELEQLASVSPEEADEILASFVQALARDDSSASLRVAKHGVLFVQIWLPRLKKKLPTAWSLLLAWEESRPTGYRPPLPMAMLVAMMCDARIIGSKHSDKEGELWWIFSALLGIGFFGLLRPGELLGLKADDISLPNSLSLGSAFSVVRIRSPKNARQISKATICHHTTSRC